MPGDAVLVALVDIAKAAARTVTSFQPAVLVAKSLRNPGKNVDGTIAKDMKCGDYTKEQIKHVRWNFALDDISADFDKVTADQLFEKFTEMAILLFSFGELQDNIVRMIKKFRDNKGGTYSDPTLVRAVENHARTHAFVKEFDSKLVKAIAFYKGDINKIVPRADIAMESRLYFNTTGDIMGGLTIATNDIWAWTVEILNYQFDGLLYSGKYKLTLFDHFGLDEPDVDDSKKYGNLAGFRAWFILQHLDRFAYKPFITEIEISRTFSGSLG